MRGRFFALVAVALLLFAPRLALAQEHPTLSGSWSASALTEKWAIGDWGDACGPKPRPQGAGGGSVQIKQQGNELTISGAGRAFSTAECWEQMPGLARTSHSASGGGRFWRTRCNTAANDSRRATVVTTISATDTSISLVETGQYQFVIQDTNCTASVTRSRSFSLVKREGDEAPAASATAEPTAAPTATATASAAPPPATAAQSAEARPPPAKPCPGGGPGTGEPARLEVRPSRKLLRPGEKFGFRAVVLDAEGCLLPARPTWTLSGGGLDGKVTVDGGGTVTVAEGAGEGKLELVATVAGKGVTVGLEVATADRYDALLASGGLNAAGEDEASAVAVIATGSIGGRGGVAEDSARERKQIFIAIVAALAAALGLAGLILWRRGRHRAADAGAEAEADADGAPPSRGPSAPPEPAAHGGEPVSRPPAVATPSKKKRGRICPSCGQRYGADAEFCGKDGTVLVPLN